MYNQNVVYGVCPKNLPTILNVNIGFTQTTMRVRGEAQDGYDDFYELDITNKNLINNWFYSLYIGNSTASVRFKVIGVLWSTQYKNTFVLMCQGPEYNNDIRLSNEIVFITPSVDGFKETNFDSMRRDGIDVDLIKFPTKDYGTAETNFDSKLGW